MVLACPFRNLVLCFSENPAVIKNSKVLRNLSLDLGRMYKLIKPITDASSKLREMLEKYIYTTGMNAIEKCGDGVVNVGKLFVACGGGLRSSA